MKIANTKSGYLSIHLSELMYLCFFVLMFFAKGIGLYDGQFIYKIVLLMSFGCLGIKMLVTKHSYLEWGIILGALGLSSIIYLYSGEKGILICTAMVVCMKDVSVERVFKLGLVTWIISAGGCFLFSLLNMNNVWMEVQHKFGHVYVPRYFMGFPHPNVLHISYFILAVLVIYALKKEYQWKHLWYLMLGNIFVFIYSFSITGFAVVTFFLLLAFYIKVKKINKFDYFLVKLVFPMCLVISILLPVFAEGNVLQIADKVFNHRIGYSKHFLQWNNITLIGNKLAEITDSVLAIDNSFVFSLIIYGVVIFGLICFSYFILIHTYVKEKKNIELAIILSFLIAGITEPLLFNTSFKNLTLLFIGALLFEKTEERAGIEYGFISKKALEIKFETEFSQTVINKVDIICEQCQKKDTYMAFVISVILSVIYSVIRKTPERIFLRKPEEIESLIVWEQIRSGVTMFFVLYVALVFIMCLVRYKKNNQQGV